MKNVLVQYEGGGYDGCFWEWNFCYFNAEGAFQNIFASGYKACKSAADLENAKRVYYYDMADPAKVEEFVKENAEQNVKGAAVWFADNYPDIDIQIACGVCGKKFPASEINFEGYRGNGGIGIIQEGVVCEDCYSSLSCSYCGEYQGKDNKLDEQGYCESCYDKNPEHEKSDEEWIKEIENAEDEIEFDAEEFRVYMQELAPIHNFSVLDLFDENKMRAHFDSLDLKEKQAYYAEVLGCRELISKVEN